MTNLQNRTLGAFEKTFWLLDQIDSKDFALAAEINGVAAEETWKQAIKEAQERHPNLSVRIIMDEYSRPKLNAVAGVEIPFRILNNVDENFRWEQEVEKELAIRFDTTQAPLVRIVLVQKALSSVLIVVAHHAIADGTAVSYLIRDLLRAVTGKKLVAMPAQISNDETLGLAEDLPKSFRDTLPTLEERKTLFSPKIETLRLNPELTQKVISKAKLEGTTVHGALCAAALISGRKLRKEWAERKIEMISPICSRKALKLDDNFGLNITTHPVYFEDEQHLPFWELARLAKAGLAGTDNLDHVRNYLEFFRQLAFDMPNISEMLGVLKEAFNHEIMVTNIGKLKFETDFGTLQLKSLYGPLVRSGKGMEQTLGVNCTDGSLCLANTSDNPILGFLEEIQHILSHAV